MLAHTVSLRDCVTLSPWWWCHFRRNSLTTRGSWRAEEWESCWIFFQSLQKTSSGDWMRSSMTPGEGVRRSLTMWLSVMSLKTSFGICFSYDHFNSCCHSVSIQVQRECAEAVSSPYRPASWPPHTFSVLDRICDAAQRGKTSQTCCPWPQLAPVLLPGCNSATGYCGAGFCNADSKMLETMPLETEQEEEAGLTWRYICPFISATTLIVKID